MFMSWGAGGHIHKNRSDETSEGDLSGGVYDAENRQGIMDREGMTS